MRYLSWPDDVIRSRTLFVMWFCQRRPMDVVEDFGVRARSVCGVPTVTRNSSGDEIANVNFFTTTLYMYSPSQRLSPLNRLPIFY